MIYRLETNKPRPKNRYKIEKLNKKPEHKIGINKRYFSLSSFLTARKDKPMQNITKPETAIKIPEKIEIKTSKADFRAFSINNSINFACSAVIEFKLTQLK
ncbi:MAG TPA: hypothetical protein ENF39_01365 [Candidatus Aenigmarchaeota archaeon]|nr:hypothetical protein [Candidatus Aenigmarchaeota archaeon]